MTPSSHLCAVLYPRIYQSTVLSQSLSNALCTFDTYRLQPMNNTTGPHLDGRLPQIHDNVRAQAPPLLRRSSKLPESFTPGAYDVICGKGKVGSTKRLSIRVVRNDYSENQPTSGKIDPQTGLPDFIVPTSTTLL